MINFQPLRISRPNTRIKEFGQMTDALSKRYEEGEVLSNEAKDILAMYETAPDDVLLKNEYSAKFNDKIGKLLKDYEGAYEDRRFQTDLKSLTREAVKDPLLNALKETKAEYDFAQNFRRKAQTDGNTNILFDNQPVRTQFDEEGNPIAGKYKGETQADWIGEAKRIVGTIKEDAWKDLEVGSLDGLLNGIQKTGWTGTSQKKMDKIADLLAVPFLQQPAGQQWLKFQEQQEGRKLSDTEKVTRAAEFIARANANQVNNKNAIDFQYVSDLNPQFKEQEEEVQPTQEYGNTPNYKIPNTDFETENSGVEYTGEVSDNILSYFTPSNWKKKTFDSKNENYRTAVKTAIEVELGQDTKEFVNLIKEGTPQEIEEAMLDLNIDLDDIIKKENDSYVKDVTNLNNLEGEEYTKESIRIANKRTKNLSKEEMINQLKSDIKSEDALFSSRFGAALGEAWKENNQEINETITISPQYKKESEFVNAENIEKRFLTSRAILDLTGGELRELKKEEAVDEKIAEEGATLLGPIDKYNIVAGMKEKFIGGNLYERPDGTQFIVASGNVNQSTNPKERRQAAVYSKLKLGNGREVELVDGSRGKVIKSEKQLEKALNQWLESLPNDASQEQINRVLLKNRYTFANGGQVAMRIDQNGNIQIDEIKELLDRRIL